MKDRGRSQVTRELNLTPLRSRHFKEDMETLMCIKKDDFQRTLKTIEKKRERELHILWEEWPQEGRLFQASRIPNP